MTQLMTQYQTIEYLRSLTEDQLRSLSHQIRSESNARHSKTKNSFRVGDLVGFTSKRGLAEDRKGEITKICQKNIQVFVKDDSIRNGGVRWTVHPSLLVKI